jgi:hypothetical protein
MKNVAILVLTIVGLTWVGNAQAKPINLNFLQRDVDQAIEQLSANLSEFNPQAFEKFYQDLQREAAQIKGQIGKAPFKTLQKKLWRLMALGEVAGYAALAKAHVTGKTLSKHFGSSDASFWRSNRELWNYENKADDSDAEVETRIFAKGRFMKRHPSIGPYFSSFE